MTSQLLDTVRYHGEALDLVTSDGTGLFDPAAHGVPVVMASTASWRGYACEYGVTGGRLQLDKLEAKLGRYDGEVLRPVEPPLLHGRPGVASTAGPFNTVYDQLALPIAFSGGLLLACAAAQEVVRRLGFAPAWVYETVHALQFADGVLRVDDDLSGAMAQMREQYARDGSMRAVPALARPELAWVVNSFLQQL